MAKRMKEKAAKIAGNKDTRARACAKYVRISPYKVRVVLDLVRGKAVNEAVSEALSEEKEEALKEENEEALKDDEDSLKDDENALKDTETDETENTESNENVEEKAE